MIPRWNEFAGLQYVASLGPAAWYRYGIGITSAGGLVSAWADQSGNGRNLVQGTGAAQPTLQASGAILFDGTSDYLQTSAFTLNQPCTYYLLLKQVSWTNGDRFCDAGAAASIVAIVQNTGSPAITTNAGSGVGDNSDLAVGAYGVVSAVFNGASSILQINNGTATSGNAGTNNPSGFTLGANRLNTAAWANIEVKEVGLFAAAHDAATRARVIRYLQQVGQL